MRVKLTCYYEHKQHPYLRIAPVKTEVLSKSPPILQFYEILSNRTIERIKDLSLQKLVLSEIVRNDEFEYLVKYRTSVGTYLNDRMVPEFSKMSEIVSGLKVVSKFEGPQVVEYVYGRYYNHHTDAVFEHYRYFATN